MVKKVKDAEELQADAGWFENLLKAIFPLVAIS